MNRNEKIDKIAELCYVKTGTVATDYFDYQKFATMIIEECASYARYETGQDWVYSSVKEYMASS